MLTFFETVWEFLSSGSPLLKPHSFQLDGEDVEKEFIRVFSSKAFRDQQFSCFLRGREFTVTPSSEGPHDVNALLQAFFEERNTCLGYEKNTREAKVQELQDLTKEEARLQREIGLLTASFAKKGVAITAATEEIDRLKEAINAVEIELGKMRTTSEELKGLQKSLEEVEEKEKKFNQEEEPKRLELESGYEKQEKEKERLEASFKILQEKKERLNQEIGGLEEKVRALLRINESEEALRQKIAGLDSDLTKANKEKAPTLRGLNRSITKEEKELAGLKRKLESLQKQREELLQNKGKLEERLKELRRNQAASFPIFERRISNECWDRQRLMQLVGLHRELYELKLKGGMSRITKLREIRSFEAGGYGLAPLYACFQTLEESIPSFREALQRAELLEGNRILFQEEKVILFFAAYLQLKLEDVSEDKFKEDKVRWEMALVKKRLELDAGELEKVVHGVLLERNKEQIAVEGLRENYEQETSPVVFTRKELLQWSFSAGNLGNLDPCGLWSLGTLLCLQVKERQTLWENPKEFSEHELQYFNREGFSVEGRDSFAKIASLFYSLQEFTGRLREFLQTIGLENFSYRVTTGRKDISTIFNSHLELHRAIKELKQKRDLTKLEAFMKKVEKKRTGKIEGILDKIEKNKGNEKALEGLQKDLRKEERKKEAEGRRFSSIRNAISSRGNVAGAAETVLREMVQEESMHGMKDEFFHATFFEKVIPFHDDLDKKGLKGSYVLPMFNSVAIVALSGENGGPQKLLDFARGMDGVYAEIGLCSYKDSIKTCILVPNRESPEKVMTNIGAHEIASLEERFASCSYVKEVLEGNMGPYADSSFQEKYEGILLDQLIKTFTSFSTQKLTCSTSERRLGYILDLHYEKQSKAPLEQGPVKGVLPTIPVHGPAERLFSFILHCTLPTYKVFKTPVINLDEMLSAFLSK